MRVLVRRATAILESKSESVVREYVEYKKKQFKDDISLTYQRKKPLRQCQIRTKRAPPLPSCVEPALATTPLCNKTTNIQLPTEKKNWRRGPRKKCCFCKCTNTERTDTQMIRVTNLPKNQPPPENGRMRDVVRFIKKRMERQFTLKACAKKDEGGQYFLCTNHQMEEVTKKTTIERKSKDNKVTKCTVQHTFMVPMGIGVKASAQPMKKSKGLGADRAQIRFINNIKNDLTCQDKTDTGEYKNLVSAATDNMDLALDFFEQNNQLESENKRLQKENEELKEQRKKGLEHGTLHHINDNNNGKSKQVLPVFTYAEMANNDKEVKRRTGFRSLDHLLAYTMIVCNGDHKKMTYKRTSLTWLEEWFLYYEYTWGRTLSRWIDAAAMYKADESTVKLVFEHKIKMAKECRARWPRYVTYEEDHALAKKKWSDKFAGKRMVMWDDTNVNFTYQPSGASEQRLTYSQYYAGNCAKGGVFLQLCGWMGVESLWVGATSDSHYQEKTKIFERQDDFAKKDLVDGKVVPFTNMLDKGYRVNVPAWRAGRQEILQPKFAASDKRFSARDTLHTADVATSRSGNERGVNVSKRSAYIKRGIRPNAKTETMDDVWLTWSFQTNFMYESVL